MVNRDWSINLEHEVKGVIYRAISTRNGKSKLAKDCLDTILNTKTGKLKEMTRQEWRDVFNKFKK